MHMLDPVCFSLKSGCNNRSTHNVAQDQSIYQFCLLPYALLPSRRLRNAFSSNFLLFLLEPASLNTIPEDVIALHAITSASPIESRL